MTDQTYALNEWATLINDWATDKGWNENITPNSFAMLIALMHSELSEALEEWRNGHDITEIYYAADDKGIQKPEGVPIELMDCIIRILHVFGRFNINADEIMQLKHEYNHTRAHRHGGKRI
jgi:hypothetical protein